MQNNLLPRPRCRHSGRAMGRARQMCRKPARIGFCAGGTNQNTNPAQIHNVRAIAWLCARRFHDFWPNQSACSVSVVGSGTEELSREPWDGEKISACGASQTSRCRFTLATAFGSVINRCEGVMHRAKHCTSLQVHEPMLPKEVFSVGV